jgi:hypothetical protein
MKVSRTPASLPSRAAAASGVAALSGAAAPPRRVAAVQRVATQRACRAMVLIPAALRQSLARVLSSLPLVAQPSLAVALRVVCAAAAQPL